MSDPVETARTALLESQHALRKAIRTGDLRTALAKVDAALASLPPPQPKKANDESTDDKE